MLYIIGIGLGTEKSLSIESIESINKCSIVYIENYTSKIGFEIENLKKLLNDNNREIILADRTLVESGTEILSKFSATTHISLFVMAKKENIKVKTLHNASIFTAIGDTGLSLYKFGKIASIPFNYKNILAPFEIFLENGCGEKMHTLFLLDLNPKENKYMNFKDGLNYFKENGDGSINSDTYFVVCAGLGTDNSVIKYGKIKDLLNIEINVYPQCIIIPGELHFMEEEMLELFRHF